MGNGTSKSESQKNQAVPQKTTLFKRKQCGPYYRIPALIYIDDAQTFLAFAEKRTSPSDCDATRLVMRRGTKGENGEIQWSSVEELSTACLEGYRTMNPCPVYEKKSKTVFLFFICVWDKITEEEQICTGNKARLCYVTSRDNGQNWSSTEDLTSSVIGDEIEKWGTFAVGPGHGIQMKSGRLIIPAYFYEISRGRQKPYLSYAFAFYSDDGKNWHFGKNVSTKSCECVMAEIIDKNDSSYLYCNARSTEGHRVEELSKNGGESFDPCPGQYLVETGNGCQGSVLSITAPQDQATKNWLLYSHPTDTKKRKDLGIYLNKSPLHGSEWSELQIIHHGPSAYSDLTTCEQPDRFACLMECRKKCELEEIAFVEFSLQDIMNNQ